MLTSTELRYDPGMRRYEDIYPSAPLLRSTGRVRPRAADLLTLEYFEAEPGTMPTEAFDQHHVLINLRDEPIRTENWRGAEHRDFLFRRDEIVVTPAGMTSGWRWHGRSQVIVITLDPKKFEAFAQSEVGILLTDRQLRDLPQFEDTDITAAATMLLEALRLGGAGSDVMFESLARVFLVKLVQKYGEERGAGASFSGAYTPRHHRRVLDLVEQRFAEAMGVDEMATVAGLSPSHFSRVFKQVIGESPYQFVMRYRTERAAAMLTDRSRPLIDIALACGFADQPHLTRVFKQLRGQTPRQWRLARSA
jgi:AraC family transcriptional regulator